MAESQTGKDRIVIRVTPEFKRLFQEACARLGHKEQFVGVRLVERWVGLDDKNKSSEILQTESEKKEVEQETPRMAKRKRGSLISE